MNRKNMRIAFLLIVLLAGCSDDKNEINLAIPTFVPEIAGKTEKFSEMAEWNDVKIFDIGFYPRFQEGPVVQSDKYIFYPDGGNMVMRIEKQTREKKCILELDETREKGAEVQICIAGDQLMMEYECDIFCCDFNGNKMKKIIGHEKVKKKIGSILHESLENENRIISGVKFYNGKLYLFSAWDCIWQLDPDNGKFSRVAESAQTACFNKNYLYYGDSDFKYIYKLNLKTGKRVRIKGNTKNSKKQYTSVMVVDNQIYYVCNEEKKRSALYLYCEGDRDKKLFTFKKPLASHEDLSRVFLEYYDFNSDMPYLQAYDIKSQKTATIKMPNDFQTVAFLAGDVLFYTNRNPKASYLSIFTIAEKEWEKIH